MVGSPSSNIFKAVLKMPDGEIKEVQLRSGDEGIAGSFCQTTEIEPGDDIEWVYVLTLANISTKGRYLHPQHWIFNPGQYEVSVVSMPNNGFRWNDELPKICTNTVSFFVIPGTENPRLIIDTKQDWGREDRIMNICVNSNRYNKIISKATIGKDSIQREAIDVLSEMSQIDIADYSKVIKLWNRYIVKYHKTTFSLDKSNIMCILWDLSKVLKRMNTKEAQELLNSFKNINK